MQLTPNYNLKSRKVRTRLIYRISMTTQMR